MPDDSPAPPPSPLARRLARHAVASLALWVVAVAGAWWYLDRSVAPEYRMGARPITDADSYGLPLVAFAVAVAAVLLVLNAIAAIAWAARRRRSVPTSRWTRGRR